MTQKSLNGVCFIFVSFACNIIASCCFVSEKNAYNIKPIKLCAAKNNENKHVGDGTPSNEKECMRVDEATGLRNQNRDDEKDLLQNVGEMSNTANDSWNTQFLQWMNGDDLVQSIKDIGSLNDTAHTNLMNFSHQNQNKSSVTQERNNVFSDSMEKNNNVQKEEPKELDEAVVTFENTDAILIEVEELQSKPHIIVPSRIEMEHPVSSKKEVTEPKASGRFFDLVEKMMSLSVAKIFRGKAHSGNQRKKEPNNFLRRKEQLQREIRHIASRVASTVEKQEEWSQFCREESGGFHLLFECIKEAALSSTNLSRFPKNRRSLFCTDKEQDFIAACTACKALRDLCAISPQLAAIVTDCVLRADNNDVIDSNNELNHLKVKKGQETLKPSILEAFVILLKSNIEFEKSNVSGILSFDQRLNIDIVNKILYRQDLQKGRRRRCCLYIIQLFLAMTMSSDRAVDSLKSTHGLVDTVVSCSSFSDDIKIESYSKRFYTFVGRFFTWRPKVKEMHLESTHDHRDERANSTTKSNSVENAYGDLINKPANKLLATLGYNTWVKKAKNQKGLRILSLDGGGTRGVTALASLRAIVDALDGKEPHEAFDIIAGTSTGGIIAFLIGLRKETIAQAKKRYDTLIKRIFVKSALSTPMLVFTTASYDAARFDNVTKEILGDSSMIDSRADPNVPMVFAVSSKMSSTPSQLCLFRNYNYNSCGIIPDKFIVNPNEARSDINFPDVDGYEDLEMFVKPQTSTKDTKKPMKNKEASEVQRSRHSGSFRVLQQIALRASTAAPTFFKPLMMGGELYCDGGVGASNPTAVAIHEARNLFPDVPIELIVSLGTGAFEQEVNSPKIGWDGILSQIVGTALDGENTHHILDDVFCQAATLDLGKSLSRTKYYRFNPVVGPPNSYPIDETKPDKLEELGQITLAYMKEDIQRAKLKEIREILL